MFDLQRCDIPGCVELQPSVRSDERGHFVKTYHADFFQEHDLKTNFVEQYYSVSQSNVLRGLHFQTPPHDHDKLVYCTAGEVLDVVVDLRRGSPSYGEYHMIALSALKANQLYIPSGLAHGFYVTTEEATMVYNVTSTYAPENDQGIKWDGAGIVWPTSTPKISERDNSFCGLKEFSSPFVFHAPYGKY